jgi:hypothetical protein
MIVLVWDGVVFLDSICNWDFCVFCKSGVAKKALCSMGSSRISRSQSGDYHLFPYRHAFCVSVIFFLPFMLLLPFLHRSFLIFVVSVFNHFSRSFRGGGVILRFFVCHHPALPLLPHLLVRFRLCPCVLVPTGVLSVFMSVHHLP